MNRKEAIEALTKTAEELKFLITDRLLSRSTKGQYIDLIDAVERLSEPLTLVDLLGWEEGVEYKCDGVELKIENGKLLYFSASYEFWEVLDLNWTDENIKNLQQATKVESKLKAYHVTDKYSYKCLMEELEEQGYDMNFKNNPSAFEGEIYIFEEENRELGFSIIKLNKVLEKYDLIEYYKEEPKFYAKIKGWELNGHDDIYWIYDSEDNIVFVGYTERKNEFGLFCYITKTEWNELGINDTNADWEEVAE